MQDHYQTLGVARDASDEVVRTAYRTLIQKYHPDRNDAADAPARTGDIVAAYSMLKTPALRAQYDSDLAYAAACAAPPIGTSNRKHRRGQGSKSARIAHWLNGVFRRKRNS